LIEDARINRATLGSKPCEITGKFYWLTVFCDQNIDLRPVKVAFLAGTMPTPNSALIAFGALEIRWLNFFLIMVSTWVK
jgi:hypothetical protein